ncbi:hypothetical protein L7F22_011624 [Adiantum nelumboides]|nr:hypothetical protein [Adiantum nelumboides]
MHSSESDQGAVSPATPAAVAADGPLWVPNSAAQAPVHRSISVAVQDHHNHHHHHLNMSSGATKDVDLEAKGKHEHSGGSYKARWKAEQIVHLIPLVLLLCALILWLGTPSTPTTIL